MSYSAKVQDIFAPGRQAPSPSGRFVLLEPLPLEVLSFGRPYRLQIETESVSGESRLLGVDLTAERAGSYSAYLVATPARKATLEAKITFQGIESQGRAGFGMFTQLVREGRARAL
jgi:hypothetical protein